MVLQIFRRPLLVLVIIQLLCVAELEFLDAIERVSATGRVIAAARESPKLILHWNRSGPDCASGTRLLQMGGINEFICRRPFNPGSNLIMSIS
jgi:hypothetical protein